jgi:hypothetical protein
MLLQSSFFVFMAQCSRYGEDDEINSLVLNVCKTIGQESGDKGKTGTDDFWY